MKQKVKQLYRKSTKGPLAPIFYHIQNIITHIYLLGLKIKYLVTSAPMPNIAQQKLVCENVTFIYKSFERQKMATRLYHNIQTYYPGVKVIIADDSRKKLELSGENLQIIQMPFNSGLSRGLNAALQKVDTPFTVRLDDDELLTPYSKFHEHLEFLLSHPEIDLVGISPWNIPREIHRKTKTKEYSKYSMSNAPKKLCIPHGTKIDHSHIVLGKVPNIFIVRSDKYKALGYDDNIRMIDHHEFFFRAAGNIVSVLNTDCYVLHYHNPFHRFYQFYRSQYQNDKVYIKIKHGLQKKNNQ